MGAITNGYHQSTLLTRNDRLQNALDRLDEAIQRQAGEVVSKQSRFYQPTQVFNSVFKRIDQTKHRIPPYKQDSRARDRWLRDFWRQEPHLAGVVNSVVSIDKNRGWTITGGRNTAIRYENILRHAEAGQGWRYWMSNASLSYYTADMGAVVEIGREGDPGPLRALYNVDPAACRLTGDPNAPLAYYDIHATKTRGYPENFGDGAPWKASDFFRVAPLPSNDQNFNGLGYCAVSRCIEMAEIMLAVYEYDQEKLGARAPTGLLLLQNISEDQWTMALKGRDAKLDGKEQQYFGAVMTIAQMGGEPPDAKLFALSQLPDGFDIEVTTNLLMYAYALCFGYEATEFWPVSAGSLGRGRETEIQHRKATGKGGQEFIFSLQDRLQQELPEALLFQFEERDAEGELLDAEVHKAWVDVAAVLAGAGILTVEQTKMYLIDKGVIDAAWSETPEAEQEGSVDDEGVERSLKHLRDEAMQHEPVRRAIYEHPNEPIVRRTFDPKTSTIKEMVLWETGESAELRSVWSLPDLGKPGLIVRPRTRAVLYEDAGVEITDEDVEAAIVAAGERVGEEYEALLRAEPVE